MAVAAAADPVYPPLMLIQPVVLAPLLKLMGVNVPAVRLAV